MPKTIVITGVSDEAVRRYFRDVVAFEERSAAGSDRTGGTS